jgi:hypothetical protein
MTEQQQKTPLYIAIDTLITAGRLTGVTTDLKLDGVPFLSAEDNTYDPTPVTFREDGTSDTMSVHGGRQIKGVEDIRAELLRSNEQKKIRVAHDLPQWFVNLDDVSNFDDKQEYYARENHSVVRMTLDVVGMYGPAVSTMDEYSPKFYDKATGEPSYAYNRPMEEVTVAKNGGNPGARIPNHRIGVIKNGTGFTPEMFTGWAQEWVDSYLQTNMMPDDSYGQGVDITD